MPIAIYHHRQLSVALPVRAYANVSNFYPRRLKDVSIDALGTTWRTSVRFHTLARRRLLELAKHETWRFERDQIVSIIQHLRNGRVIHTTEQIIPPAFPMVWTENAREAQIWEKFELGFSVRAIIEQHLHFHVPNPMHYKIVVVEFDPAKETQPLYHALAVRPPQLEMAEHKENADEWERLFLD